MGCTIWSMHFIAILAINFPVSVNYDFGKTLASAGIAMIATGIGLYFATTRKLGRLSIPFGGLMMGIGIAGMHYLGMIAIQGCGMSFDIRLVAASVAIAVFASIAALWFTFSKRNAAMTILGGVVQGLAISSMHYVGMVGTFFVPLGMEFEAASPMVSQRLLALAVGLVAVCVGNFGLISLVLVQRSRSA